MNTTTTTNTTSDEHGNVIAVEGCTRCACGAKYWENDVCVSCGEHARRIITTTTTTAIRDHHVKDAIRAGWKIPTDAVINTYRGRPGCGCGCRGTYSMTKRAVTMRTKYVNEWMSDFIDSTDRIIFTSVDGPWVDHGDNGETVFCISFTDTDENSTCWVYIDAEKIENSVWLAALAQSIDAHYA